MASIARSQSRSCCGKRDISAGINSSELKWRVTQAELAAIVHREPLAVSRWERGECAIDNNVQAIIRLVAMERLNIDTEHSVQELTGWCVPTAAEMPIDIDGQNPDHYRPLAA